VTVQLAVPLAELLLVTVREALPELEPETEFEMEMLCEFETEMLFELETEIEPEAEVEGESGHSKRRTLLFAVSTTKRSKSKKLS
jgi:hypothetical protein